MIVFFSFTVNSEGFPNNDILGETVTINFASGETEQVHMINIIQDSLEEDNEKFLVTLVEKSGVMLGEPSSETLVIVCKYMYIVRLPMYTFVVFVSFFSK